MLSISRDPSVHEVGCLNPQIMDMAYMLKR